MLKIDYQDQDQPKIKNQSLRSFFNNFINSNGIVLKNKPSLLACRQPPLNDLECKQNNLAYIKYKSNLFEAQITLLALPWK